jgi:uncharacterized membrane protein YdbT with pleckstrin-like domain
MSEETTLFRGSSSQVLNLGALSLCGLGVIGLAAASIYWTQWWPLAILVVPVAIAGWRWLRIRCRVYEVTTERVRVSDGILTRRTDELELYRVEDIRLIEPLLLRSFGLGNIVVSSNDVSNPTLELPAIRGVKQLREDLRKAVEACRERKRVRVTELE